MALTLDIMRHGEAAHRSPDGDASRMLTPSGIRGVESVTRRLLVRGEWNPAHAFASPYLRAIQTARIVLDTARATAPLLCVRELEPERDPAEIFGVLIQHEATAGHTFLVAHMPIVERLVAYLVGKPLGFAPGMIARVECPFGPAASGARVAWCITPDDLG